MNPTSLALLFAVLATAVAFDLRSRRIPNQCVLAGLALGLACNIYGASAGHVSPVYAVWPWLAGAVVGLVLLLPAYLMRMLGAGDVKLMAAVGGFLGPGAAVGAVLFALLAGGVLSMAAALATRSTARVAHNLRAMFYAVLAGRSAALGFSEVQTTGRLPYAIAIAFGTALQLFAAADPRWMIR